MSKFRACFNDNICYVVVFCIFNFFAIQATAQSQGTASTDPADTIHVAIVEVMSAMRDNEKLYKEDPEKLQEIIAKIVLPYLSIPHMAQLSMGKNWKNMSDGQRSAIIKAYQTYLIRNYTNTLFVYRYTTPEVLNRTDNDSNKAVLKVSVKNEIGNTTALLIRLEKNNDRWQILDVSVEGVSLVITSRGQFDEEISKKGIEGFIQSFSEKNKKEAPGDYN